MDTEDSVGLRTTVGKSYLREIDGTDRRAGVDVVDQLVGHVQPDGGLGLFGRPACGAKEQGSLTAHPYDQRGYGSSVPMCGVRSVLFRPRRSHSQFSEKLPGSMSCGYTSTYAPACAEAINNPL
jgi:hypothetical protein